MASSEGKAPALAGTSDEGGLELVVNPLPKAQPRTVINANRENTKNKHAFRRLTNIALNPRNHNSLLSQYSEGPTRDKVESALKAYQRASSARLCCSLLPCACGKVDVDDCVLRQERQLVRKSIADDNEPKDTLVNLFYDAMLSLACIKHPRFFHPERPKFVVAFRILQAITLIVFVWTHVLWHFGWGACEQSIRTFGEDWTKDRFDCPIHQDAMRSLNLTARSGTDVLMKVLHYNGTRGQFIAWQAQTRSYVIWQAELLRRIMMTGLLIASMVTAMGGFGGTAEEALVPPLLEVITDEDAQPCLFRFSRPRHMIHLVGGVLGLVLGLMANIGIGRGGRGNNRLSFFVGQMLAVMSSSTLLMSIMIGVIIQSHNATVLGYLLSTCTNLDEFKKWKKHFKLVLGSLHIWSWRLSPVMLFMLLFMVFGLVEVFSRILVIWSFVFYSGEFGDAEVITNSTVEFNREVNSDLFVEFFNAAFGYLAIFLFSSIFLIVGVLGPLAYIDSCYNRVVVLMATLPIPDLGKNLDDIILLNERVAAFTLFNNPITMATARALLRALFFTVFGFIIVTTTEGARVIGSASEKSL